MIIAQTIEERDSVEGAILMASNGDGTWTVYQQGDEIPPEFAWIFEGA